jgi:hypothetical protein
VRGCSRRGCRGRATCACSMCLCALIFVLVVVTHVHTAYTHIPCMQTPKRAVRLLVEEGRLLERKSHRRAPSSFPLPHDLSSPFSILRANEEERSCRRGPSPPNALERCVRPQLLWRTRRRVAALDGRPPWPATTGGFRQKGSLESPT